MGKIRIKIPGLGSKAAPVTSRSAEIRAQRLAAEKEALEQQQLTGTTDDILKEEELTNAPDVLNLHMRQGEAGENTPLKRKFGAEAMEHQVYPVDTKDPKSYGKSVLQRTGSAISGIPRRIGNTKDFMWESAAKSLGATELAEDAVEKQAKTVLKGANTSDAESASKFAETLSTEIEHIDSSFYKKYKKIGDVVDFPIVMQLRTLQALWTIG